MKPILLAKLVLRLIIHQWLPERKRHLQLVLFFEHKRKYKLRDERNKLKLKH